MNSKIAFALISTVVALGIGGFFAVQNYRQSRKSKREIKIVHSLKQIGKTPILWDDKVEDPKQNESPKVIDNNDELASVEQLKIPLEEKNWTYKVLEFVWIPQLKSWVSKYEVTNMQFNLFNAGHNSGTYKGHNLNNPGCPAVNLTFKQAKAYCNQFNTLLKADGIEGFEIRLLTAEEWTKLAKCGADREYPWGNSRIPSFGNLKDHKEFTPECFENYKDGYKVTCPVDKSGKNSQGIYGLAGNVHEICTDRNGKPVLKGGSWKSGRHIFVSCGFESEISADYKDSTIGFRLILVKK